MVTIKIQSADDIIRAYLQSLGFANADVQKNIRFLKDKAGTSLTDGDKIIKALDNIILTSAKKVFCNSSLDDEQLIALFKLCFLQANGADKWGHKIFETLKEDDDIAKSLREYVVYVAPDYVFSQMKPQEIDIPHPSHLLKKIFKHKKR